MTQKSIQTIICAKCGKTYEKELIDSLDITNDKEALEFLISGNIFKETCPHCNKSFYNDRPLSCIDLNKKFMVQYAPYPEIFKAVLESIESDDNKMEDGFIFRIVIDGMRKFIEKVGLLSYGLNDIVAEVYKEILYINLRDDRIEDMLYQFDYECTNTKIMIMKEDSCEYYDIDIEMFNSLVEDVSDRGVIGRNNDYVVNRDLAMKILYNRGDLKPIHLDILEDLEAEA